MVCRFCCRSPEDLIKYAFNIYLGEGQNQLGPTEIEHLMTDVNGVTSKKQGADWMLANYDSNKNAHISWSEFQECIKATPSVFKKVFVFQVLY